MRILTVRQPWAHAIVHEGKDVENRVRNIAGDYRGPVAIHAGLKRFDPRSEEGSLVAEITGYRPLMYMPTQYGHIIGVVDLVEVHFTDACRDIAEDGTYSACSLWALDPYWHIELANPRPIAEPIQYKGALGLRTLDAETVARIEAAIA